jgi:hypothetical protein
MVPEEKRKMNDVLFIILLGILAFILFIMSMYGLGAGHLTFLAAPVDSNGRLCGVADMIGFPNLYYYDLDGTNTSAKYATCVKICPDSSTFQFKMTDCMKTELIHDCTIPYGRGYSTETKYLYCVRKNENVALDSKRDVYRDFELTAPAIFICLILGVAYTMSYLYVLSRYTKQIAIFFIGICNLLLLIGFCTCLYGTVKVDYPAGAWLGALLFMAILVLLNLIIYYF